MSKPPLQQILWHFRFVENYGNEQSCRVSIKLSSVFGNCLFHSFILFLFSSFFTLIFVCLFVCFSERIWASWKIVHNYKKNIKVMKNVDVFQIGQIVP